MDREAVKLGPCVNNGLFPTVSWKFGRTYISEGHTPLVLAFGFGGESNLMLDVSDSYLIDDDHSIAYLAINSESC